MRLRFFLRSIQMELITPYNVLIWATISTKGRIIATRPGHKINNLFARAIRKEVKRQEIQVPFYDPNKEPVMDVNRIKGLLPHRYQMLLYDKII